MGLWENIMLAIAGLKANKMRSLLTMLGIIIGISSVITISTLGVIMENSVKGIFSSLGGSNLVGFGIHMKEDAERDYYLDEDFITFDMVDEIGERFADDIEAMSLYSGNQSGTVTIRRKEYDAQVYGVNGGFMQTNSSPVVAGRNISDKDCDRGSTVCLISQAQAKKLYGSTRAAIGQSLTVLIQGRMFEFTVVGIYEYKLPAMLSSFIDVDSWNAEIYIPYTTLVRLLDASEDFYQFQILTKDDVDTEKFTEEVRDYLNNSHYRDNNAVEIYSQTAQSQMDMISEILGVLSLAISVIAGISLLVGGIGVMNIMLVSVTERTREIGVRKALGAPNSAIRTQFVTESVIICLIGGAIGIVVGILMGNVAGLIIGTMAAPSIGSIFLAVGFSMAIGIFFGYYPANKAAKLDPIEALRYE